MDNETVKFDCPIKMAQFVAELTKQGVCWKCEPSRHDPAVWEIALTGGY